MPRFHDGKTWTDVLPVKEAPVEPQKKKNRFNFFRRRSSTGSKDSKDKAPVSPVLDGDGKILVTIPSYRDGEQCGQTLQSLFLNADDPDNIVVSLIEQQNEKEVSCVEAYCHAVKNVDILTRAEYRKERFSVISNALAKSLCPRIDQIRVVRVHEYSSKGPPWARAMGRRSLGDEQFCMHISAHTSLSKDWDATARTEWLSANNEFAILSNPPKPKDGQGDSQYPIVPRLCNVEFLEEEKLPHYDVHPDGKVEGLTKPLLSHTWNPGFSFGKCHMEEAAPSDGFLPYVSSDIEAFARYARMWTRGYDVYTPTKNIVLKNYWENPHKLEWINNWYGIKSHFLKKSLKRIRSYLEIPAAEDESSAEKLDNLGIYGLGKRRTLKQLNEFVGIDLESMKSRSSDIPCGNFEWVPYDSNISPMENLYSNPDDLDPQPEFPFRTNLTFSVNNVGDSMMDLDEDPSSSTLHSNMTASPLDASRVPYGTLIFFWILGIGFWCNVFVFSSKQPSGRARRKKNKNK